MSTIDYKALAERIKTLADANALRYSENPPYIADLRTVVSLLEGMAEAPEGFALVPKMPSNEVWQEAESAFHRAGAETFRRPGDVHAIWREQISAAFRVFAFTAPHPAPQPQSPSDVSHIYRPTSDAEQPQPEPIDPHMIVAEDRFPDDEADLVRIRDVMRKYGWQCRDCCEEILALFRPQQPERQPMSDDYIRGYDAGFIVGAEKGRSEPTEAQIEQLHRLLEVVLHELVRLASPFTTLQTIDVAGKRFIAAFVQGILATHPPANELSTFGPYTYWIADAMLAERDKENNDAAR